MMALLKVIEAAVGNLISEQEAGRVLAAFQANNPLQQNG
jgi:hypothetical protein